MFHITLFDSAPVVSVPVRIVGGQHYFSTAAGQVDRKVRSSQRGKGVAECLHDLQSLLHAGGEMGNTLHGINVKEIMRLDAQMCQIFE